MGYSRFDIRIIEEERLGKPQNASTGIVDEDDNSIVYIIGASHTTAAALEKDFLGIVPMFFSFTSL